MVQIYKNMKRSVYTVYTFRERLSILRLFVAHGQLEHSHKFGVGRLAALYFDRNQLIAIVTCVAITLNDVLL